MKATQESVLSWEQAQGLPTPKLDLLCWPSWAPASVPSQGRGLPAQQVHGHWVLLAAPREPAAQHPVPTRHRELHLKQRS